MMNEFPRQPRPFSPSAGVRVELVGGPDEVSRQWTVVAHRLANGRLKIPHGNGYEHFELVEDSPRAVPATFHWVMRTKIAE